MGTITERRRKDGSTAYMAQVVISREGKVHRENQTFDRRPAANAWIKKREKELSAPGGIALAKAAKRIPTFGEAIDRYTAESPKAIGRTKEQVLSAVKKHAIADLACDEVTSQELVKLGNELVQQRQPQTVGNYMSHISAIFSIARPAWGFPLDSRQMEDAQVVMKRLGIISKSKERDRRPTFSELDLVLTHYGEMSRRRPKSIPMQKLVVFSIFSTRRQEESTTLRWADYEPENKRVLVRDMKNPGQKIGNNVWCELPDEAIRIIDSMEKVDDRIFPFAADSISASHTRACQFLGIEDLHFHDYRHEGISRLFEMGRTIPQVASVSGHRSWQSLKRYTHLRQIGDKYSDWPWLDRVAPKAST